MILVCGWRGGGGTRGEGAVLDVVEVEEVAQFFGGDGLQAVLDHAQPALGAAEAAGDGGDGQVVVVAGFAERRADPALANGGGVPGRHLSRMSLSVVARVRNRGD